MKRSCERCLMPFAKDPGQRQSELYCSYCFRDGKFVYEGDNLSEFKKYCYKAMVEKGMNKYLAKFYTFMISFAPYWKRKKQKP